MISDFLYICRFLLFPVFFRKKNFYQPLVERLQEAGLETEIIDLGINVGDINKAANVVTRFLKRTDEKDDIIAHSFGGLILKQVLLADPGIATLIRSISFAAVPHRGSWAALLVPIWPAALNMLPFSKNIKTISKVILPENVMNFLPETEIKIWPKRSSRLSDYVDAVIPKTNHDSIISDQDFSRRVIEFIKTCE